MLHFISRGSNYILMLMCGIYALSSFTIFLPSSESAQKGRMDRQEAFVYVFHFICFLVLFLQTLNPRILLLYLGQFLFFRLLIAIYSRLYTDSSRVIMNHTC
ncbi:MAG: hypothetical protein IKX76_04895, partial [Eubacterium sp.]|nr:hypothetical protein [Eubacterium sp.]